VLEGAAQLDFATMIERLRANGLATYKLPEQLEVVDEIPRSASGKIQKHLLVDRLAVDGAPDASG
jgi:non-ribosomal peptide synthetase component E (peptide arylation enzyme)